MTLAIESEPPCEEVSRMSVVASGAKWTSTSCRAGSAGGDMALAPARNGSPVAGHVLLERGEFVCSDGFESSFGKNLQPPTHCIHAAEELQCISSRPDEDEVAVIEVRV